MHDHEFSQEKRYDMTNSQMRERKRYDVENCAILFILIVTKFVINVAHVIYFERV